jgi:hypothetical protein
MASAPRTDRVVLGFLAIGIGWASGCAPTCDQVCGKLVRCDVVDGLNRLECEESCDRQAALYELDDDEVAAAAFDDHRSCIGSSTCEELDAGVCYDPVLFPF